jgi:hypothetical protein
MSHLRSVTTDLRIYRGIVESLGTYARLDTVIHKSLHEQELDGRVISPRYIGASLLSKCDFKAMQRKHHELRVTPVERLINDIDDYLPDSASWSYEVILKEAVARGNRRDGYAIGATFDSEFFDREKHAIYRALGKTADSYLTVSEDYSLKFGYMAVPFPDCTVAALQAELPRSITLEPIISAVFSN